MSRHPKTMAVGAFLAAFSAVDQMVVLPHRQGRCQLLIVAQTLKLVRSQRRSRLDLDHLPSATPFVKQVQLVANIVAPEVEIWTTARVDVLFDYLGNDPIFKNCPA